MYLNIITVMLNLAYVMPYVNYDIFPGFDVKKSPDDKTMFKSTILTTPITIPLTIPTNTPNSTATLTTNPPVTNTINSTINTTEEPTTVYPLSISSSKFDCPEVEAPSNIGVYEVPTHRDIALLLRNSLMNRFKSYHEKALYFLNDIKEVTKATAAIERKCHGYGTDSVQYKKCVRQVGNKCEIITKGLVTSLERQRADVLAFTNGSVCNAKALKTDPVELVKILAMEEASLEFALPGFLRLLDGCSTYCIRTEPKTRPKKPVRHMTDQDLVVKHFLTQKNYIQLIKGSK